MDEGNNEGAEGAQTGESQSAADSGPQYVTPDMLGEFRAGLQKDLVNDVRKVVAGMLKTQQSADTPPQQKTQQKEQANAQESAPDIQSIIRRERQIERAMASAGLNDKQSEMVRKMLDASNPDDVSEFVNEIASTMGIKAESANESKPMAKPNPSSDGGTPGMTPSIESDDTPMHKWSQSKVDAYIKQHGWRKFAQVAKERLPRELSGVRFSLTDRQG